jgi:DNA-binding CsgD family transcriptional regulator
MSYLDPKIGEAISATQRQYLDLVCAGLSNRRIAKKLGVCENTVKRQLFVIFAKLNVKCRSECVAKYGFIRLTREHDEVTEKLHSKIAERDETIKLLSARIKLLTGVAYDERRGETQ